MHCFESTKLKKVSSTSKSLSLSQVKSFRSQDNETLFHYKPICGKVHGVHPEVEGSSTTLAP